MNCDHCGKPIRFPLKDARIKHTSSSYQIVVRYYCEECYPKFKTGYDPYNRSDPQEHHSNGS